MNEQNLDSIIEFVDLIENDKAIAIVRIGSGIGLTLSLEHGSDTEVFMRHSEAVKLAHLLQEAIQQHESEIVHQIESLITAELPNLPSHLQEWAKNHLIAPKQMIFSKTDDGDGEVILWLITDHTNNRDSSSRIVYDEIAKSFGLVMDMKNDVKWFMGLYGSFTETINAM